MILTDLAILVSGGPVIAASDGHEGEVAALYVLAYLAAGPIHHGVSGTRAKVRRSIAKRLVFPVIGGGPALLAAAVSDCSGGEFCELGAVLAGGIGAVLGVLIAVISDWTTAHVDLPVAPVTPTVTVDGDRVAVGLGGRF